MAVPELLFDNNHALGLQVTPRVTAALTARRIGMRAADQMPFDHLIFPKSVTIEAYCSFPNQIEFYDIGAFSYAETKHYLGRVKVGRYTSIGSDVEAFGERHPTEWVTQSMITYDFGYPGIRMGHEDFGGGLPVPAEVPNRFGGVITIGHDVWIGRHVQIARGVNIGHGAVVAAGSVVTRDIEPYTIVGGVPARSLRSRFADGVVEALLASRWWDFEPTILWSFGFEDPSAFCRQLFEAQQSGDIKMFEPRHTTASELLADLEQIPDR